MVEKRSRRGSGGRRIGIIEGDDKARRGAEWEGWGRKWEEPPTSFHQNLVQWQAFDHF